MKVVITGASGLIGRSLSAALSKAGHSATAMKVRAEGVDAAALSGADAVVHLAGEPIAEGRWNAQKKEKIRASRSDGTRLLVDAIGKMAARPKVLVSSSAIGYYGDRGEELLREDSRPGMGFLPEVCRAWEDAAIVAEQAGVRVVRIRTGIVLSRKGGALAKMLPPFLMGAGGKLGSGEQYMSWISLDDQVGAILHALTNGTVRGAVNLVSPNPATNLDFTKALGRALGRPTIFPMPAFAARLAFGELADALLLASLRVEPAVLKETGYRFQYPDLSQALRHHVNDRV